MKKIIIILVMTAGNIFAQQPLILNGDGTLKSPLDFFLKNSGLLNQSVTGFANLASANTFTASQTIAPLAGAATLQILPPSGLSSYLQLFQNDGGGIFGHAWNFEHATNNNLIFKFQNTADFPNTTTTVLTLTAGSSYFSNALGVGGSPASNAALDLQSTTKAFLPPRMTTTQKNAISSPANGSVVYDSTLNKLSAYENGAWVTFQPLNANLTTLSGTTPGAFGLNVLAMNVATDITWARAAQIYDAGNDFTIFIAADGEATFDNFSTINFNGSTWFAFYQALGFVAQANVGQENSVSANGTPAPLTTTDNTVLNFGTTDPIVDAPDDGTYNIHAMVLIDYVGATFASDRIITLKVRQISGTPVDISPTATYITTHTGTFTFPSQAITLPVAPNINANAGDQFAITASIDTGPSAGSVTFSGAVITMERIK